MFKVVKYLIIAAMAAMLCGCVSDGDPRDASWALGAGDPLPEFAVSTTDGVLVTNTSLKGASAVIVFFNSSCGDCRRELPEVQRQYEQIAARGLKAQFICIAREDGNEKVLKFWNDLKLTMPVSPQSTRVVYEKFASSIIPRVFIADETGIIVASFEETAGDIVRVVENLQ